MRPFTRNQFSRHNYIIPNLHPDYKVVTTTEITRDGNEYTKHTYSVKGTALTITAPMAVINEEWYEIFSVTNRGWIRGYDSTVAQSAGLVDIRHSWDGEDATIDALYYKSNPEKLFLNNGKIRKGIWKALENRLLSHRWIYSTYSKELLAAAISSLPEDIQNDDSKLLNFMHSVHNIELFKCYLTNIVYPWHFVRYYKFSNGEKCVHSSVSPMDFGYTRHDLGSNYIYLTSDEVLIDFRVYKRSEVTWCECPVCQNQVPTQSIIDGECFTCNRNLYKIHNYSTKVPELLKFKAKNVKPSTVYLGIELEYESSDRELSKIKVGKTLQGHAIMKSDGSIKNGFEIVTCPATLDIHLEEFKKFYNSYDSLAIHPDTNTGMHVHVSRKPLNVFTIGKMTEFLNRMDNKNFIKFIAGRVDNNYAKITGRSVTYPFLNGTSGERYNALNLQNKDTIEFRIFSTPKNWEEFSSRLEFCQALTDYCKPAQVNTSLKELTGHRSFMNWVLINRKSYPELSNYLKGFA